MESWEGMPARQFGLIARTQLRRLGFTEGAIQWKVEAGALDEMLPGVFRLCGTPQNWEQRMMAACLWGGPRACASHKSAAALWEFSGFTRGPLEVSARKQNRTQVAFKVRPSGGRGAAPARGAAGAGITSRRPLSSRRPREIL